MLIVSVMTGINHYVREDIDEDGNMEALVCWLDITTIVWAFIMPVGVIIAFNFCVVAIVVHVAYQAVSLKR